MAVFTPVTKQRLSWPSQESNHVPTGNTFTTISKERLSWETPEPSSAVAVDEVDFLFSNGTDFLFSDDTDYVFVEAVAGGSAPRSPTVWTLPSKTRLSWQN